MSVGVEVNVPDVGGWTALHAAAESGHMTVVQELLKAGADLNIQVGVQTECSTDITN